ncbi:hypothetical protein F5887DRAFT_919193 [Amanita rubescens]|nr:hypothetical protein F5887DRAFT_919193 [Amanita rubescens]
MNDNYDWDGASSALAEVASGLMKSDILTFHLIYPVKENEPSEEVVFAIQGIIYRQDLPPFDKQIPASSTKQIKYLRQADRYHEKKLQPCSFIDHYGKYTGIEMSNSKSVPFNSDIDPKGILTRAAGTNFIHAEQNVVSYYECSVASTGNTSYKEITPVKFCVGDLVEAQLLNSDVGTTKRRPIQINARIEVLDNA